MHIIFSQYVPTWSHKDCKHYVVSEQCFNYFDYLQYTASRGSQTSFLCWSSIEVLCDKLSARREENEAESQGMSIGCNTSSSRGVYCCEKLPPLKIFWMRSWVKFSSVLFKCSFVKCFFFSLTGFIDRRIITVCQNTTSICK